MEWNALQATYDSDTLRAAYRDGHGKTRGLGKLLVPARVTSRRHRATILQRVRDTHHPTRRVRPQATVALAKGPSQNCCTGVAPKRLFVPWLLHSSAGTTEL